jgi:hypothetical protein
MVLPYGSFDHTQPFPLISVVRQRIPHRLQKSLAAVRRRCGFDQEGEDVIPCRDARERLRIEFSVHE